MLGEQICENSQHIIMLELPLGMDGEALSRVFINDGEHAEGPPVMCSVSDEVVGPYMTFMLRSQPHTGTVVKPEPAALWLPLWDFKPFAPPDPFHSLNVDSPSVATEQSRNPAVAISTILLRQADNSGCQMRFIEGHNLRLTLCGTVLAENMTRTALGYAEHIAYMVNGQPTARRA